MKKPFYLIAVIFLALCNKSTAQNILTNSSFESGSTGWTPSVTAPSAATFNIISSDTLWGANSLFANVTNYNNVPTTIRYFATAATTVANTNYVISFWAKSSVVGAKLNVEADFNSGTDVSRDMTLDTAWRYYQYNVVTPAGSSNLMLEFFFKNVGNFTIDECRIITEANWFNDANYRINIARKGKFKIKVIKPDMTPYAADSVYIYQKMHQYPFGTAMALNANIIANYKIYHDTMAAYFNTGVAENVGKWYLQERTEGVTNYVKHDSLIRWADSVGWHKLRGHALLWGGCKSFHLAQWQAPEYNMALGGCPAVGTGSALTPAKWFQIGEIRATRDVNYFKNSIPEWDVLNEGGHETYVRGASGGTDSIYYQFFRWAKMADPNMKMAINDYSIMENNYTSAMTGYENLINLIDSKLAASGLGKIDIAGTQGHFFAGDITGTGRIQINNIRRSVDRFTAMSKDVKFTEFDVPSNNFNRDGDMCGGCTEASQAQNTAELMRFSFSHPAVTSLMFWGFWDGQHWRSSQGAGMWRANWTRKPAADSLAAILKKEWVTNDSAVLNSNGEREFRGFYAKYTIKIKLPGVNRYKYIDTTLYQQFNNQTVTIQLSNADMLTALSYSNTVFTAQKESHKATLKLHVQDHENNERYILEESEDGIKWTTLAVAVIENSQKSQTYVWQDANLIPGANYYRVKIIESDGKYSYTKIKVVNYNGNNSILQLSPNPAYNSVTVSLPKEWLKAPLKIEIFSSEGKMVKQLPGIKESITVNIDIKNLANGLYTVIAKNLSTNESQLSKLIISH